MLFLLTSKGKLSIAFKVLVDEIKMENVENFGLVPTSLLLTFRK